MKLAFKPRIIDELQYTLQVDVHLDGAREVFDHYPEVNPPDVVVDIGAHIGTLSLFAALNGSRFVYAIEADPINYQHLVANIKENKLEHRILPWCVAVADKSFELRNLYICDYNSGMRTLKSPYKGGKARPVWTISLEDLLTPVIEKFGKVDFLKIDVEGAEYEILSPRGFRLDRILNNVQYIDLECHQKVDGEYITVADTEPEEAHGLVNWLSMLGFAVERTGPHYRFWRNKYLLKT